MIIAGWLQVDPEQRDAYLQATLDVTKAARVANGCLAFSQTADTVDPGRILVYERWQGDADVQAFRNQPDSGESFGDQPEVIEADIRRFTVTDEGPP